MVNKNALNFQKFKGKHLLAIDFGEKFTGISTYKVDIDPYPLLWGRLAYESDPQMISQILKICESEVIDILILGLPRLLDGQETSMTSRIRLFYQSLQKAWNPEDVYLQDETLSSFEAQERMKSSPQFNFKVDMRQIDAVAASIIMEEFVSSDKLEQ